MVDLENNSWIKQVPNQLTLLRIAIIPLFVLLAPWDYTPFNYFAGALFAFASITDWFDGFLARTFKAESSLGAILDPIADKLLVGSALVVLAARYQNYSPIFALLMIREIGISGLRLIALERGVTVSVSNYGKVKTVLLDTSITCFAVGTNLFGWPWMEVGFITLVLGTILSLYSAWLYWLNFSKATSL
jgi:CDP-diacylglycerol--glycerol-3-phosphate 3-phosphatidyltransferase